LGLGARHKRHAACLSSRAVFRHQPAAWRII